jgi:hypothetical protein
MTNVNIIAGKKDNKSRRKDEGGKIGEVDLMFTFAQFPIIDNK